MVVNITKNVTLPPGFTDEVAYLDALLAFVSKYSSQWQESWDVPNFIVADQWHQHVSPEWRVLDAGDTETRGLIALANHGHVEDSWPESLKSYIRDAFELALPRHPRITLEAVSPTSRCHLTNMKNKKRSEIRKLGDTIHDLARQNGVEHILDVGCGQGYLDLLLAHEHGYHVVAVDDNAIQHEGAVRRSKKAAHTDRSGSVSFGRRRITPKDTFEDLIPPDRSNDNGWLLCGLHACGDLSPQLLRLFSQAPEAKVLALVGCCYNLLSETSTAGSNPDTNSSQTGFPLSNHISSKRFHLGYTARNLACQATGRWNVDSTELSYTRLFYRALLQCVLVDLNVIDTANGEVDEANTVVVGRFKKNVAAKGFATYARAALKRLNVESGSISDDMLEQYEKRYSKERKRLAISWTLRSISSSLLESLILIDRFLFVGEEIERVYSNRDDTDVAVDMYPVFSPVESPRNMIIVARKPSRLSQDSSKTDV
ncbi:hypothetical protein SeMB42_g06399 [Synchytrium endobioticum]|uniref:Methyltransferase domain-containing protein n=1 Tax=Synchytrium endobioticum TaxID=286115 RepID=A0A507CLR3_9FUNG|nr:hypothetical protein SeMB42_g06399 [Synchytrium endobioticum]TPX41918.1 hypothetical protein SeLEV6574_g05861 [Synchytrium endobioticum]